MKTGRNQPCPCGSGLKYKRCCLTRNKYEHYIDSSLIEGTDFKHIIPKATLVYERIKDYDFQDLIVATFCLNSWRRNRSALAQALTIHLALSTDKAFGNKHIKDYSEFQDFFAIISDLVAVTV
jgi:hypothetical protein